MNKSLHWDFFKEANGENVDNSHTTENTIDAFAWAAEYAQKLANIHQCGIGFSANEGATSYRYPNRKKKGRPAKPDAKTNAERQAAFKARKKAEGKCPCCGQLLPQAKN